MTEPIKIDTAWMAQAAPKLADALGDTLDELAAAKETLDTIRKIMADPQYDRNPTDRIEAIGKVVNG